METNLKAHESPDDSSPLHLVFDNPINLISYVQPSMKPHNIFKVIIVRLIWTLLSSALFFISMSLVPRTPSFQLISLFVSDFSISNTTFRADWDVTLKIQNLNSVSMVHINSIKGSISYQSSSLAMYSVEPFELAYKEHRLVHIKISKYRTMTTNRWALGEISKHKDENGAVDFDLRMLVSSTYSTWWWWGLEKVVLNPQCLDLKVGFLPIAGFGSWINKGPMRCPVPILS